jgi:hypothetical protein
MNQLSIKIKCMDPLSNTEQREGKVARAIEEQTAKFPSDIFLWAAIGAMAVSLALQLTNARHRSLFIGQWAPSLLLFGIYNKIVKVAGHDKEDNEDDDIL